MIFFSQCRESILAKSCNYFPQVVNLFATAQIFLRAQFATCATLVVNFSHKFVLRSWECPSSYINLFFTGNNVCINRKATISSVARGRSCRACSEVTSSWQDGTMDGNDNVTEMNRATSCKPTVSYTVTKAEITVPWFSPSSLHFVIISYSTGPCCTGCRAGVITWFILCICMLSL